jgi:CBS domain-containing protein
MAGIDGRARPVVVAVDQTDSAAVAVRWAAPVASQEGRSLHLLHVTDQADPAPGLPNWLSDLVARARELGGDVTASVETGELGEQLYDWSRDARLLVMGSYGTGRSAGMLAGPHALEMVAEAACPLVVVRNVADREGPVVVGVDGGQAGERALRVAAALAAARPTGELLAVHCWSDVAIDSEGHPRRSSDDGLELAENADRLLRDRLAELTRHNNRLSVASTVVDDTPVRALLKAALNASMVVVGHRRLAPGGGTRAGSTSRALVEFAESPVVIVPPTVDTRRVEDIMTTHVLTTTPGSRATDAALVIALNDISALPVLDAGTVVGLLSEQDVLRVRDTAEQQNLTVASAMHPCALLVAPDTPVVDLIDGINHTGQDAVPVVRDGILVGIVSRRDLAKPGPGRRD